MKLRVIPFAVAIAACSQQAEPVTQDEKAPAVAEETAPAAAEEKEEPAAEEPASDPVKVCEALVAAANAGDAEAFGENATDAAVEAMSKSEEVANTVMATIGEATCGEATVEGETATVSVAVGDTTRDIPFAMSEQAWKFDGAAYLEKYPPEMPKAAKGKKGKKKRRKKRKG